MNDGVIVNPNFKHKGDLERSLIARGKGAKDFPNTHTEVEYLGNGKFGASIGVGHKVFFDKADDNKPKKHKLTDERPNYVLIQGAKCCVEVHPYYAKYFDVQHEEVRLEEERWVVQRLFAEPDTWRDVDTYNPQIAVEEYPESADNVVKVTITYDSDYGTLIVEYFQRDGNALKHNVYFKNTSGSTETFRVLQKWAGIVADKVNGKDFPLDTDEPFLAFRKADKKLAIIENLSSMVFNEDGSEKTDQCLQRPIKIEAHARGMKADFVYGNWVLAQDESLEIDPDTVTLDNPTENGFIRTVTSKFTGGTVLLFGVDDNLNSNRVHRTYVEWNVSGIDDGVTILDTIFKYEGQIHNVNATNSDIKAILNHQPSTHPSGSGAGEINEVWDEVTSSTAYVSSHPTFPIVGTNQSIDLGTDADTDLKSQLSVDWFAIGIKTQESEDPPFNDVWTHEIHSEEYASTPDPTLYVEYGPGGPDTIRVSWTKGAGADKTMVRRQEDSYPATPADGIQAYFDTGATFDNTGLLTGKHYYYRAWSWKDGAPGDGYSDDYVEDEEWTSVAGENFDRFSSVIVGIVSTSSRALAIDRDSLTLIGTLASATRALTFDRDSSVIISDLISASKSWNKTITSAVLVGIVATASKVYGTVKSASVIVGNLVSASRIPNFPRSALVLVGNLVTASKSFNRDITSSVIVGVVASASRIYGAVKSTSVIIGIVVSATKTYFSGITEYVRSAAVSIGVAVSASRTVAITRSAATLIGNLVSASRVYKGARTTNVLIGNLVSVSRAIAYTRSALTLIGNLVTASKVRGAVKAASVEIGVLVTASRVMAFARQAAVQIGNLVSASRAMAYARYARRKMLRWD